MKEEGGGKRWWRWKLRVSRRRMRTRRWRKLRVGRIRRRMIRKGRKVRMTVRTMKERMR